jgi:hypothetical protein
MASRFSTASAMAGYIASMTSASICAPGLASSSAAAPSEAPITPIFSPGRLRANQASATRTPCSSRSAAVGAARNPAGHVAFLVRDQDRGGKQVGRGIAHRMVNGRAEVLTDAAHGARKQHKKTGEGDQAALRLWPH